MYVQQIVADTNCYLKMIETQLANDAKWDYSVSESLRSISDRLRRLEEICAPLVTIGRLAVIESRLRALEQQDALGAVEVMEGHEQTPCGEEADKGTQQASNSTAKEKSYDRRPPSKDSHLFRPINIPRAQTGKVADNNDMEE